MQDACPAGHRVIASSEAPAVRLVGRRIVPPEGQSGPSRIPFPTYPSPSMTAYSTMIIP